MFEDGPFVLWQELELDVILAVEAAENSLACPLHIESNQRLVSTACLAPLLDFGTVDVKVGSVNDLGDSHSRGNVPCPMDPTSWYVS